MRHVIRRIGPAALLLAGVAAFGCGGNSTSTPRNSNVVDVRNGRWKVTSVLTYTGGDSCAAIAPETTAVTDTLCGVDLTAGGGAIRFACDVNLDGENFTFDCTGTVANLDPCRLTVQLSGQGTVTDTTFTITTDQAESLTGPDVPCAIYRKDVPRCVAHAVLTGAWQDTVGSWKCPADTSVVPAP